MGFTVKDPPWGYQIPTARGVNFGLAYDEILTWILNFGAESVPRGFRTRELLAVQLCVSDARQNVLVNSARDPNYRFMVAEWLWMAAGRSDVATVARYNKEMTKFSDDGKTFAGAYGPHLKRQWRYVLASLKKPDSRQAVTTIWQPSPKDSKDIPCTIGIQFLIRNKTLHSIVTMRSSDAWLGLPYDFFNFSMITNWVATIVGVDVGSLTMQFGSSHLYEQHWEAAANATKIGSRTIQSPRLKIPIPAEADDWPKPLQALVIDDIFDEKIDFPEPWSYYQAVLRSKTRHDALEHLRHAATIDS